jgi:hypothetical protein
MKRSAKNSGDGPMNGGKAMPAKLPRILVKWNLPLVAADLKAYLESLPADDLSSTGDRIKNFLEPYNLSRMTSIGLT